MKSQLRNFLQTVAVAVIFELETPDFFEHVGNFVLFKKCAVRFKLALTVFEILGPLYQKTMRFLA